jgi:hypothetical protein
MGKVVMGGGGAEAATAEWQCAAEHHKDGGAMIGGRDGFRAGLERTGEVGFR